MNVKKTSNGAIPPIYMYIEQRLTQDAFFIMYLAGDQKVKIVIAGYCHRDQCRWHQHSGVPDRYRSIPVPDWVPLFRYHIALGIGRSTWTAGILLIFSERLGLFCSSIEIIEIPRLKNLMGA